MTELRDIDLNLLVALDALLDERHITRAAQRLGISQPAGSHALERCRALFGDELLERRWGEFQLTPKARALRARVKSLLAEISGLLEPPTTDLHEVERAVRMIMSDCIATRLLRGLLPRLRERAPGVSLVFLPWQGGTEAAAAIIAGDADLAVSVLPPPDDRCRRVQLIEERYRVVMDCRHPAAASFDLESWLSFRHVFVSASGESKGPLDDQLQQLGRSRRVGVVVPSFNLVPEVLLSSDLIAMLPTRCIPDDPRFVVHDPPIAVEGFPVHLGWHRRNDSDPAVQHVAQLIADLSV